MSPIARHFLAVWIRRSVVASLSLGLLNVLLMLCAGYRVAAIPASMRSSWIAMPRWGSAHLSVLDSPPNQLDCTDVRAELLWDRASHKEHVWCLGPLVVGKLSTLELVQSNPDEVVRRTWGYAVCQ